MPPESTARFTTLWEPPRPIVSFLALVPVTVLSSVFLGFVLVTFVDDRNTALIVAFSIAALAIIVRIGIWCTRSGRSALVSSDIAIGIRIGSKIVFETPWVDIVSIKLDRGDPLPQLMLDFTGTFRNYPHFTTTAPGRWSEGSMSPGLIAFLPKDYQLLTAALAEECRRRSVPFSYD